MGFLIYCLVALLWIIYDSIFKKKKIYVLPHRYLYDIPRRLFGRPAIPRRVREEVFSRANYACAYCRSPYELQVDHIYPFSKGGANHITNYQCLCKSCNIKKGAKIPGRIY